MPVYVAFGIFYHSFDVSSVSTIEMAKVKINSTKNYAEI